MAWNSIVASIVLTLSLAGGQLLFKLAATSIAERRAESWLHALASPWLIAALAVYGLSTALWIAILTKEPLSKAYPFALAGAAFVPLLAHVVLAEPLSARYWLGIWIILAGIMLTQSS